MIRMAQVRVQIRVRPADQWDGSEKNRSFDGWTVVCLIDEASPHLVALTDAARKVYENLEEPR